MTIEGAIYATKALSDAAIASAEETWLPPDLTNVGGGRYVDRALLTPQRIAEPIQLVTQEWFVPRVGAYFSGSFVDPADILYPPTVVFTEGDV